MPCNCWPYNYWPHNCWPHKYWKFRSLSWNISQKLWELWVRVVFIVEVRHSLSKKVGFICFKFGLFWFCVWFWAKYLSGYVLLTYPIAFISSKIRQYVYCICLFSVYDIINFKINLSFLHETVFLHGQKTKTQI